MELGQIVERIASLVPLIDVARCFKFVEERKDINNELFNLTKDTVSKCLTS